MELNEYQKKALYTAMFKEEWAIIYPALKLAGEAGEVAEKIGKVLRDNDGKFNENKKYEIAREIGDVLWYIATLSHNIGYSLEEIAVINIEKLADRKKRNKITGSGDNR
ncbi:MAG: nucleoside triphosphate pyrophosphohydrolase family protein [Thiohalospira sp.]